MKITDGKKLVDIRIQRWNGTGYDPDWSEDYFDAGNLPRDEDSGIYIVEDVDYCVDMAWSTDAEGACSKLDPETGEAVEDEDMYVIVKEVKPYWPKDVALMLRLSKEWIPDLCDTLVMWASRHNPDLEADWNVSNVDPEAVDPESVLFRAADFLGVKIV